MSNIDWIVLLGTLLFIVIYGVYKTRGSKNMEAYLRGNNDMKWWTIGLSIMATQASAITFLSTPGQAYADGMRFIQFYFGLPLAMIVLSVTFVPIYYKLKVYTAYEFLESRFDLKTRILAAGLFLVQRGLAAGITIYAPSIILSSLLGWNLGTTNLFIGALVIIYTVSGGTKAVSVTQKQQMAVMMGGMILAGLFVIHYLPKEIGFSDALNVAGKMGKLDVVDFTFDLSDRYNFWSGMTGAFFLFMSYFGTDQSQVQRYLSGRSIAESRLGLMMNGLLKVPMQFIILFIGVMVFVFFQFNQPPVFFNQVQLDKLRTSQYADQLLVLEAEHQTIFELKDKAVRELSVAVKSGNEARTNELKDLALSLEAEGKAVHAQVGQLIQQNDPNAEINDKDYVFMSFVMNSLPIGLVGLLFAVIFSAAMSSTASELNALASTTTIDVYKRTINKSSSDGHYVFSTKIFTLLWGLIAILFATYLSLFENLIQAVNLLGSLIYGTILGIFVVAFYMKSVKSNAVFIAALISQTSIGILHYLNTINVVSIGFLWYNAIGCIIVMFVGLLIQLFIGRPKTL
jgi:solute:Na+ symporter, SSS family